MRARIEQIIGREAMRKLIAEFGGQQLYIPRLHRLDEADVLEVRELKAAGARVEDLARRKSVSVRAIYKALSRRN